MKSCCKEAFENESSEEMNNYSDKKSPSTLMKLQKKWKAKNIFHVILILITFTIGGSICGYLGRKILNLTSLESGPLWVVSYIILVTVLWPVCVLLISMLFGQYKFFKGYIHRMATRMFGKKNANSELPTE